MAQSFRRLLCKNKRLSSDPQHPYKDMTPSAILELRGGDRQSPGVHCSVSDAKEVINYGPGLKAIHSFVHEIVSQHLTLKIVSD